MGGLLPSFNNRDEYRKVFPRDEVWEAAMRVVCERLGLPCREGVRDASGTNIVYLFDSRKTVVKLYAPVFPCQFEREECALKFVAGKLRGVETPEVITTDEIEGWPYLVMNILEGVALRDVWPQIGRSDRLEIVSRLGELVSSLHRLPTSELAPLDRDWDAFVRRQIEHCFKHHQERRLPDEWLRQIPAYLASRSALLTENPTKVFLHGDLTDDHVLLAQEHGRWKISGLFDFGDACLGAREYEFAAPSIDILNEPPLRRAFLLAYGYDVRDLTPRLSAHLMLYLLLHNYTVLTEILDHFKDDASLSTLEQLERKIWSLDA